MQFLRKIGRRGQVSVPTEIRETCEIQNGDLVEFQIVRVVKRASPGGPARTVAHNQHGVGA